MNDGSRIARDGGATMDVEQFVEMNFALRASTLNEETRSVEAVFATEDPIRSIVRGEVVDEVILLRGMELPAVLPLVDSHPEAMRAPTTEDIRGSGRQMRIEGRDLVGRLFFDEEEPAERAFGKVKRGHLRSVSIGAQRLQSVRIPAGRSQTIAGRTFTAKDVPLLVTLRSRAKEISITPFGLDPRATIRAATFNTEVDKVNPQLLAYLVTLGLRRDASDDQAETFYRGLEGQQREFADSLRTSTDAGDNVQRTQPAGGQRTDTGEGAGGDNVQRTQPAGGQRTDTGEGAGGDNVQRTQPAGGQRTDTGSGDAEIRRAERERMTMVRGLGEELHIDADLVTRAIDSEWDEAEIHREFLNHVRRRRGNGAGVDNRAPAGHSYDHDSQCTGEVLGAALMIRGGLALDCETFAGVHARQALHANRSTRWLAQGINDDRRQQIMELAHRYAGLSAIDICREAIRLDGGQLPHGYDDIIARAVSGGSLANVFTTSAHAQLIESYTVAMDSTRGWVREADNINFQTNERPRLKKGGGLQKLPRGASAEHRGFDDAAESYKIARYAEQFVVDEQDIIDDRLNALMDVPMEMGEDAAQLRPDLVYSVLFANDALADGTALFASGRSNLRTNAALAFATLQNAILDMTTQTEGDKNLNIRPTHFIGPWALAFTAAQILTSVETRSEQDSGTEVGTRNAINVIAGQLMRAHDARLDNGVTDPDSGTTHSGATGDYFLADSRRPAIEVGYRRGTGRSPQMRSFTLDKGQWGIGWDINLDIGVKAIRALSIHKSEE